MCGIVGYAGNVETACGKPLEVCLQGLQRLEYRGYDSAGLAVQNAAGKIEVVKAKGRLRVLSEMTDEGKAVQGRLRHRAYPLGNPRRTQRGERTPALQPRPENCSCA